MSIHDGDILPMIGGPKDGEDRRVDFLFEFLNGGVAPAAVSYGQHFYRLDHERRAWVYVEKEDMQ
jgi:hypothetical protein